MTTTITQSIHRTCGHYHRQLQPQKRLACLTLLLLAVVLAEAAENGQPTTRLFSSRAQRPSRFQQQAPPATGTAVEVAPPANPSPASQASAASSTSASGTNRTTRTADIFQNGDGYNIFVTNTCERDSMKVNIKTSRAFYGVIHTKDQRQKPGCVVEGTGDVEYNLEISHVLNSQDPAYCGVIRAPRASPEEKDTLSVVLAVRVHRNIQLSDDKYFLLNCTNRCRRADCSSSSGKLLGGENGRLAEEETTSAGERESTNTGVSSGQGKQEDECTIWKFPWVITLLWCLGILLLAMIISHCIMCSSLICRCVKTEVEEREPSVYEGATDYDSDDYNKKHPFQIEYDNRDIYKTSNNYAPYNLEEAQAKSRRHKRSAR